MKADITKYLRTEAPLYNINFDFDGLKVWPSAYKGSLDDLFKIVR